MTTTTHLTGEQLAHVRDTLDAMRAAGPEHFNMDRWFVEGEYPLTLRAYRRVRIDDCGTSACLAGFAALTADATDTMPVYDDTEGMHWFYVGCWPQWARDMLDDERPGR
jgi:hypothetical protein